MTGPSCPHDLVQPFAGEAVSQHERPAGAHRTSIPVHDRWVGPHMWGQVDLVDHQQIGVGDAGPPLPGDLSPSATSMTKDKVVGENPTVRERQAVATRLDQDDIRVREPRSAP
jgi:hypothetical protein